MTVGTTRHCCTRIKCSKAVFTGVAILEAPASCPNTHIAHAGSTRNLRQAVTCVNLVDQKGSEGTLEAAFAKEAAQ